MAAHNVESGLSGRRPRRRPASLTNSSLTSLQLGGVASRYAYGERANASAPKRTYMSAAIRVCSSAASLERYTRHNFKKMGEKLRSALSLNLWSNRVDWRTATSSSSSWARRAYARRAGARGTGGGWGGTREAACWTQCAALEGRPVRATWSASVLKRMSSQAQKRSESESASECSRWTRSDWSPRKAKSTPTRSY